MKKQQLVILMAMLAVAATLVWAPWQAESKLWFGGRVITTTAPVWAPPYPGAHCQLLFGVLLAEWLGIAVLAGGALLLLKLGAKPSPPIIRSHTLSHTVGSKTRDSDTQ